MAILKTKEKSLHDKIKKHFKQILFGVGGFLVTLLLLRIFKRIIFLFLLPVPIIYSFYHLKKIWIYWHGVRGERVVLKKLLNLSDEFIIYNDITIYDKDSVEQIDHIVISPYGIFCIETKNLKGTIKGYEEDKKWVQKKIGKKGKSYKKKFYNPCMQCKSYVFELKNLLNKKGVEDISIEPIVVFTRLWSSRLKVKTTTSVIKVNKLVKYIYEFKDHGRSINNDSIEKIQNILETTIDKGRIL